jgi:aminotransferase
VIVPSLALSQSLAIFAGGNPVVVETHVENDFRDRRGNRTRDHAQWLLIGYPNNPTGAVMTRQ